MTICRKCGKEISDGEELCEDCKNAEMNSGESYLDELMLGMGIEDVEEPAASGTSIVAQKIGEKAAEELSAEEIPEEEMLAEEMPAEEIPAEEIPEEELPAEEKPEEEMPVEEDSTEDINDLLDLLSKDYEEEGLEPEPEEYEEDEAVSTDDTWQQPAETGEASLFSEDETGDIFADGSDSIAVDDIFEDALSAVDYSENENKQEADEEELMALDPFALEEEEAPAEEEVPEAEEEIQSVPVTEPLEIAQAEKEKEPKAEKKDSFWKRIFGNIITEQTAEEEAKEREQEKASAEEKALEKEEKKKQAEAAKEEKAEQKQAEKERKAAEKAERATAKAAEKEEKKRLKLQREQNEVVGRINPVGASIVMVFFGLICICVILGCQMLSYSSAVKNAESSFKSNNYRKAYESIAGVDISDSSKEMADKIRICMQLQKELDSYSNYYEMKMYLEALDSLMKGIRSYDTNRQKADNYGIMSQYNALESKVAAALSSEFGVSETQARSINSIEDLAEYTARLEEIIYRWEARNKEDER